MAKTDLKDAYLAVPVKIEFHKLLRFVWKGKYYQCVAMPFGLSSAPRTFTKLMKPLVAYLRRRGIRLIIYLDDMLILNKEQAGLIVDLELSPRMIESLGFVINYAKLVVPTKSIEYLGLILNSKDMPLSLTKKRISEFINLCNEMSGSSETSRKILEQLLGKFSWAEAAVPFVIITLCKQCNTLKRVF